MLQSLKKFQKSPKNLTGVKIKRTCPKCKNGVNEPKQAKRGTILVVDPIGNKKETITATAFDKNITVIQQYEAQHDGSPVVFQIKLRKEIVDGKLEYTLNELATA